jgi:hypothetical protein
MADLNVVEGESEVRAWLELGRNGRVGEDDPARLDADTVLPTIPLLGRISVTIDAELIVRISPRAA